MFKKEKIEDLKVNLIKAIHLDWPVLTVKDNNKVNGMTVNWVQLGYLWNKHVVTVYVRPQRHTFPLINEEETFSLAFFPESEKDNLAYLGKASGRDEDKLAHCNYTVLWEKGTPVIEQANMVFICKKRYVSNLKLEEFQDQSIVDNCYAHHDFHHVFVAEITEVLIKE